MGPLYVNVNEILSPNSADFNCRDKSQVSGHTSSYYKAFTSRTVTQPSLVVVTQPLLVAGYKALLY